MTEHDNPLRVEYGEELDGLRIVRQPSPPGAESFSASYVGPAGWGFDPAGREGTARLVCRLAASAAGSRDRVELARALDRAGATLSARCAAESAELTVWGPSENWEPLLGILADVVLRPRFDASDLARARRQIRELQLREASQPAHRAERELLHAAFPRGHPYRGTGIGSRESVDRTQRSDLVRFHRRQYTSGEAMLVVTTPHRREAVERLARRLFSRFAEARAPALRVPEVARPRERKHAIDLPGRSQVEVRLGGASIPRRSPAYPAAELANELLGGRPLLSRLFQRVRERGGLAYHASSTLEAMRYGGFWEVQAGTGGDRWPTVVEMLEEEVERIRERTVSPRELRAIRESAIGEIPLALESTAEAHELAVDVAYHRLEPDHWITWPATLRSQNPRTVREAAEVAFDRRYAVSVLTGPLGGSSRRPGSSRSSRA